MSSERPSERRNSTGSFFASAYAASVRPSPLPPAPPSESPLDPVPLPLRRDGCAVARLDGGASPPLRVVEQVGSSEAESGDDAVEVAAGVAVDQPAILLLVHLEAIVMVAWAGQRAVHPSPQGRT